MIRPAQLPCRGGDRAAFRFIPVHADDTRFMSCLLEYEAGRVIVRDPVYEREGDLCTLHRNSYAKLRLPLECVAHEVEAAGFAIGLAGPGRLVTLAARRA